VGRDKLQRGTVLRFSDGRSFEILETIGGGGSALLYEAKEQGSELRLAIKELYPSDGFVRRKGQVTPISGKYTLAPLRQTLEEREIYLSQRASRRNHQVLFALPPIWNSVDMILPDGTCYSGVENTYVCMESLRDKGMTLGEFLERLRQEKKLSLDTALDVMDTVLDAYATLHEDGFIHGDCQKENLFLLRCNGAGVGTACIIDFDSARALLEDGFTAEVTDDIYATDGYCAPELLLREEGFRMSPACDVWSLGFLLLELLTDRGMEAQSNLTEYLVFQPSERRLSRREAYRLGCTPAQWKLLNGILKKAMHAEREARYPNAGAMRAALQQLRRCRELDLSEGLDGVLLWEGVYRWYKKSPLWDWHHYLDRPPITVMAKGSDGNEGDVVALLEKMAVEKKDTYFSGRGGSGKSCAVGELLGRLLEKGERIPLYLDLRQHGSAVAVLGIEGLFHQLGRQYCGGAAAAKEIEELIVHAGQPVALVLDHFHAVTWEQHRKILGVIRGIRATWKDLWILVVGRDKNSIPLDERVVLADNEAFSRLPYFYQQAAWSKEPAELLAAYYMGTEYSSGDREIHTLLQETLPALAAWQLSAHRETICREELAEWLQERCGGLGWQEDSLERFLYSSIDRLAVLEETAPGKYRFAGCFAYFAAADIAARVRWIFRTGDLAFLEPVNGLWPEEINDLWPVLCVGEVGESGFHMLWSLPKLFDELYKLIKERKNNTGRSVGVFCRNVARFCRGKQKLHSREGKWLALAEEIEAGA